MKPPGLPGAAGVVTRTSAGPTLAAPGKPGGFITGDLPQPLIASVIKRRRHAQPDQPADDAGDRLPPPRRGPASV